MTLAEIRDMLDAATGPSREIDGSIARAFKLFPEYCLDGPELCGDAAAWAGGGEWWIAPRYSSSIDAALALVARLLPGWETCNASQGRLLGHKTSTWYWEIWNPEYEEDDGHSGRCGESAPTAPIGILKALVTALIAKGEQS